MIYYQKIINNESKAFNSFFCVIGSLLGIKEYYDGRQTGNTSVWLKNSFQCSLWKGKEWFSTGPDPKHPHIYIAYIRRHIKLY